MKQCLLGDGIFSHVAWIPDQFAVVGKVIDLRDEKGEWSRGWIVRDVYPQRLKYEYVREHERDYKSQREASDI